MASFVSDDAISTHSSITIPEETPVEVHVSADGTEVNVSFGVNQRVMLDLHHSSYAVLLDSLLHTREVQQAKYEKALAESRAALAAMVAQQRPAGDKH
ncbi:hypothetical protein [Actinoalloteichus fjordicus]|uniref:Uncharacterized protein n=1 Tax=Actinoalloteichus fjordicus TaxID=1612552 RepID=A0AAC9PRR9_9PSEU|nr:hypothetical protein [Actinoalloteichus fjordicus]APU14300.1 hypothetical protein UA74_11200 [Actinoalloteichus fjordicus]